jgi:methylmalonyl-CoA mutase
VLEDLEGGVSSIWLQLGPGATPIEAIPEVLAEVYLDLAPVILDAGEQARPAAETFLAFARSRVADDQLQGVLGMDPLGLLARTGVEVGMAGAVDLAQLCARELPLVRAVVVDALPFHEAGGTDVEELGASLAAGVAYLRALTDAGMSMPAALGQLEFRYSATADQFATIAKFRAARRLWARVAQSCGAGDDPAAGQRQHAVTSWSMTTRRDPWNNILRGTLACMSAGVGGADAITVLPFDAALGLPDALARRVARNTHALLAEESNRPAAPFTSKASPRSWPGTPGPGSSRSSGPVAWPRPCAAGWWATGSPPAARPAAPRWRTGPKP